MIVSLCKEGKEMVIKNLPVECLECGKKFKTGTMFPTCPKCKGVDIDLYYDKGE